MSLCRSSTCPSASITGGHSAMSFPPFISLSSSAKKRWAIFRTRGSYHRIGNCQLLSDQQIPGFVSEDAVREFLKLGRRVRASLIVPALFRVFVVANRNCHVDKSNAPVVFHSH